MSRFWSAAVLLTLGGVAGIVALPFLISRTPGSLASLEFGTDDAFAVEGLEPREDQVGGAILRWTRREAGFRFEGAGPGLVDMELVARDHRTELTLIANGAIIGNLSPDERRFGSRVSLPGTSLDFRIETDGFADAHRTLGTQVISLNVVPVRARNPSPADVPMRLWAALGLVVVVAALAQALSGLSLVFGLIPPAAFLAMVLPAGLWRSGWLFECAAKVVLATIVSVLVSRFAVGQRRVLGCLQAALFLGVTIHGIIPPSPLVMQSDVLFHAHKLGLVARGNAFPTSLTDHRPSFEIPYGVSFYGLLAPGSSSAAGNVRLVREASALFSVLSVAALALLAGRTSASLAAAALVLWTFSPVNIRTMAFGNLSNIFAQAVFVLFLAGAAVRRPGVIGSAVLALLVAVAGTAHLSSFIVVVAFLAASFLIPTDRRHTAFRPLLAGAALSGAYYACFLPMILAQAPRLLTERGGSGGVFDPWRLPSQLLLGVGWPLILLLGLSAFLVRVRPVLPMARSLALAGVGLAVVGLVSPVEVRYLLALVPLMALVGAAAFDPVDPPTGPASARTFGAGDAGWRRFGSKAEPKWLLASGLLMWAALHGTRVLLEFTPLSGF